ncbi:uncharacterized protein LOC119218828 isoform X2 [Pungitius pungitius]|uniref:uncharacterized protein LOC119218828 isoform X2 n=1 Tax=Pungitius pungitius TaxID=134920 RepID=UPI002E162D08
MISLGEVTGFWIIALLTLHCAVVGETKRNILNEPNVPFPPACPTAENLAAVCHQGQGRPRYPASFFPKSRWKQTLKQFCMEEYSTMTNAYVCCRKKGAARWACFNSDLPNPNYDPQLGYIAPAIPAQPRLAFNASAC